MNTVTTISSHESEVAAFFWHVTCANQAVHPALYVRLHHTLAAPASHPRLVDTTFVEVALTIYDETTGDSQHLLAQERFDPSWMRSRLYCDIYAGSGESTGQITSLTATTIFTVTKDLPQRILIQNTHEEWSETITGVLQKHVLPFLRSIGLSTDKKDWMPVGF